MAKKKDNIVEPEKVIKVKVKSLKIKAEPEITEVEIINPPTKEVKVIETTKIIKNVAVIGFDKQVNSFIKKHSKDIGVKYFKITKVEEIINDITYDYYIKTHKLHELKEYGFIMNIFKQKIKENGKY